MRKPRGDANLKTLSAEMQADIIARCNAKGGTYQKVVAWLNAEVLEEGTSVGALSDFFHWWHFNQQMVQTKSTVQQVKDMLAQGNLGLTPEQIREYGDLTFIAESTRLGDPKTYVAMAKVLQTDKKLKQNEKILAQNDRRIALLEKKAAQADKAKDLLQDETLTMEQRNAKMRETFGMA